MDTLRLVLEKREAASPFYRFLSPLLAIVMALVLGAVFLAASGFSPLKVYYYMWWGAFSDWYGISETLVTSIPIMLCALGVALAAKMLLWNVAPKANSTWARSRCVGGASCQRAGGQVLPLMVLAGSSQAPFGLTACGSPGVLGSTIITTLAELRGDLLVEYLVQAVARSGESHFPVGPVQRS